MNPKCSIIVPVYNSEVYLSRCVESVRRLSLSWELIMIDDGSSDDSGTICDAYALKDNRIKVFHQPNSGVSVARNKGLDEMHGEYVVFLDSDDSIDASNLEYCIHEMDSTQVDLLQSPTNKIPDSHLSSICNNKSGRVYDTEEYIQSGSYYVCIGGNIIRSKVIDHNHLRFRENIKLAEDQIFVMDVMNSSKRIYYITSSFYNYYINSASATNSSKSDSIIDSIGALVGYREMYSKYINSIDYSLLYFIWYIIKNNDVPIYMQCELIKRAKISSSNRFSNIEKAFILISACSPLGGIYFVRLYKFVRKWL